MNDSKRHFKKVLKKSIIKSCNNPSFDHEDQDKRTERRLSDGKELAVENNFDRVRLADVTGKIKLLRAKGVGGYTYATLKAEHDGVDITFQFVIPRDLNSLITDYVMS